MPALPLIAEPHRYRACIQDLLADGPEILDYWLTLFERHVETLARLPLAARQLQHHARWTAFRADYLAGLQALRARPDLRGELTVLELTRYRDEKLALHGLGDPFIDLKTRENELALRLYPGLIDELDATPADAMVELLARGLFAGNLFDMGSKAAVDAFEGGAFNFHDARSKVRPRPWAVDDLDAWQQRLIVGVPHRQALFFVDNAGPDIILGAIPLARALALRGTRVVLAANSRPALNDITAEELLALLPRMGQADPILTRLLHDDRIAVVASGCESPLIDLAQVSADCCAAAGDSDLLILEGMGRAIESNYDAAFTVDTIKVALIKDAMVARILGVRLFDPVFRFEPSNQPVTESSR